LNEKNDRKIRISFLASACLILLGSLCIINSRGFGASPPFISISEISSGTLSVVRTKLDKGANPDRINRDGQTLLWEAAFVGRVDMVRLLLSYGANPDFPDFSGKSPLYWAATNGNAHIVRLLLAHGADPNRTDGEGSAIDWAIANGHGEVVRILKNWTKIRRHYLLDRLPVFLNLISRKDRVRLEKGRLIRGELPYALPRGLTTGPWQSRQSFIRKALETDRVKISIQFGGERKYPLWRKNAILEIAANLRGPFLRPGPH
jgi:hypothetical protein